MKLEFLLFMLHFNTTKKKLLKYAKSSSIPENPYVMSQSEDVSLNM